MVKPQNRNAETTFDNSEALRVHAYADEGPSHCAINQCAVPKQNVINKYTHNSYVNTILKIKWICKFTGDSCIPEFSFYRVLPFSQRAMGWSARKLQGKIPNIFEFF
jgi:hypothetical protein